MNVVHDTREMDMLSHSDNVKHEGDKKDTKWNCKKLAELYSYPQGHVGQI